MCLWTVHRPWGVYHAWVQCQRLGGVPMTLQSQLSSISSHGEEEWASEEGGEGRKEEEESLSSIPVSPPSLGTPTGTPGLRPRSRSHTRSLDGSEEEYRTPTLTPTTEGALAAAWRPRLCKTGSPLQALRLPPPRPRPRTKQLFRGRRWRKGWRWVRRGQGLSLRVQGRVSLGRACSR